MTIFSSFIRMFSFIEVQQCQESFVIRNSHKTTTPHKTTLEFLTVWAEALPHNTTHQKSRALVGQNARSLYHNNATTWTTTTSDNATSQLSPFIFHIAITLTWAWFRKNSLPYLSTHVQDSTATQWGARCSTAASLGNSLWVGGTQCGAAPSVLHPSAPGSLLPGNGAGRLVGHPTWSTMSPQNLS